MSRMTMFFVSSFDTTPTPAGAIEFHHSHHGARAVWEELAGRYGIDTGIRNRAELWGLARHPDVPVSDRAVMAATFDYAWLKRENFRRFVELMAAACLPVDCHYRADGPMAQALLENADNAAVAGVCWQQTSAASNVWAGDGRFRSISEVGATEVIEAATEQIAPQTVGVPDLGPEPEPDADPVRDGEVTDDPAKYRRLSEPFEDNAEASAAMRGFVAAVWAAREKYGIPDVVVCMECNVKVPVEGGGWTEERAAAQANCGESTRVPMILARVLSRAHDAQTKALIAQVTAEPPAPATGDVNIMAAILTRQASSAALIARLATDHASELCDRADAAIKKMSGAAREPENGANPPAPAAVPSDDDD